MVSRYLWLLLFGLTACTDTPKSKAPLAADPYYETIMEGLLRPWSMVFLSENEVLLAEKDGDILRIDLGSGQRTAIGGFPPDLMDSTLANANWYEPGVFPNNITETRMVKFNEGIFDLRLDPDFKNNQFLYVSYAAKGDSGSTLKVIRGKLIDNQLTEVQTLLEPKPYEPGLFHYGGGLLFGKDGKLYITVGERLFSEGLEPPLPVAQDPTDERGKIYRINPDGSIPEDNPELGDGAVPGLYALGIRAAQGLCLDPNSGRIWFSEHGTRQGDEINVLKAGANYGWPVRTTGGYRIPNYEPPAMEGIDFTAPVWFWKQTVAPTGLCFYEGGDFPDWANQLIVPGLSGGSLWRVKIKEETVLSLEQLIVDQPIRLRKAVPSPAGKLYVLSDEVNGRIIRLRNASILE